jgi:hypothetical protein
MTGSTSRYRELAVPRGSVPIGTKKIPAAAAPSPLSRLKAFFFGRRVEVRRVPPLKNAHYIAVHMAAAANHRHILR